MSRWTAEDLKAYIAAAKERLESLNPNAPIEQVINIIIQEITNNLKVKLVSGNMQVIGVRVMSNTNTESGEVVLQIITR